jgi:hypothetical protein
MKNSTDKFRQRRWFVLHWVAVLFFSIGLVACDNSTSSPQSSSDASLNQVTNGANTATELSNSVNTATELSAQVKCSDLERFKSLAQLSWLPATNPGDEQRIDVTIFKDGFDTGNFESSKPMPADASSYLLQDVQGQALHRWRVATISGTDVFFSETARFEGVVCVGDVIAEQPPVPVP